MRLHSWQLVLVGLAISAPALADYGGKPDMPPPVQTGNNGVSSTAPGGETSPRQSAEAYYKDAYDDVMKGSKDALDGKDKSATKRFSRALERSRHAVELDSTYYQAWNLVGFASRKLGDYPGSFRAYKVALRIKPDFALAREYYGEGLLETGDVAGAMQQLAMLKQIGDEAMIAELQKAIDRHQAAKGDSSATSGSK